MRDCVGRRERGVHRPHAKRRLRSQPPTGADAVSCQQTANAAVSVDRYGRVQVEAAAKGSRRVRRFTRGASGRDDANAIGRHLQ